jgi:hypothetical protein
MNKFRIEQESGVLKGQKRIPGAEDFSIQSQYLKKKTRKFEIKLSILIKFYIGIEGYKEN